MYLFNFVIEKTSLRYRSFRRITAVLASFLILTNGLLVSCGPTNQDVQRVKSSFFNDEGDEGSGDDSGDDSGDNSGSDNDDGGDDGSSEDGDSGGADEGSDDGDSSPGTIEKPSPRGPRADGEGRSSGGDRSGGTGPRSASVSVDGNVTTMEFSGPEDTKDNRDRDTEVDKGAEREKRMDESTSVTEDASVEADRNDKVVEGQPTLEKNEGVDSGSVPKPGNKAPGNGNAGGNGGPGGDEGSAGGNAGTAKPKEKRTFENTGAMNKNTDALEDNISSIVNSVNSLFGAAEPTFANQIGAAVTTHNSAVGVAFAGAALLAVPIGITMPAWVIAAAVAVTVGAILANSNIDWNAVGDILSSDSTDQNVEKEREKLEDATNLDDKDQISVEDTDGDGKPNVQRNADGTPKIDGHAIERLEERGVTPEQVADALENPIKIKEGKTTEKGRSRQYIGHGATVVVNPDTGKVITTWKNSFKKR